MENNRRNEKGAVLILVVVGLTTLLAMIGLAIDVGYWYQRRAWIQTTADLSALAGLQSVNANASGPAQATSAVNVAKALIQNNGFTMTEWGVAATTKTQDGITFADSLSVSHTAPVPTFFWRALSTASPIMVTSAKAEGALTQKIFPPCGVIAVNANNADVGFDSRGGGKGVFDSFNSTIADYNPTRDTTPFDHDSNGQGICANGGIGMGANSKLGGSELAEGSADAPGQHDPPTGVSAADAIAGEGPHFTFEGFFVPQLIKDYQAKTATINNPTGYGTSTAADITRPLEPGKTYYFTDISSGISLQACNSCSPSNVVSVYWDGNYSEGGTININDSTLCAATCLNIFGLKDPGTFSTKGGDSKIKANFVIPTYTLDMRGNGDFFGGLIANIIDIKGTVNFAFDEAVGNRFFSRPPERIKVHLTE